MPLRFLFFFASISAFMASTHGYLGWRLARPLPPDRRRRIWALAALSALALPGALIASRLVASPALGTALAWTAYVHMGLFTLLLATVLAFDLAVGALALGDHLAHRLRGRRPSDDLLPAQPERRQALLRGAHLGLLGLTGLQGGAGFAWSQRPLAVREVEVPVAGLDPALAGLRIVQLTDVHVGSLIRADFVREMVDKVNALSPDLVAITGDLVDGSVPELAAHTAPLADLRARHGTFFCTGNHEYYSGVHPWVEELRRLGLRVLLNQHEVRDHDGAALVIAGVTDLHAEGIEPAHTPDLAAAMADAPAGAFRLLLAHQPGAVVEAPAHQVDLQLSGHTHGGQYFPGTLLVHLAHPYVRDLHLHEGRTWIYVSCGTGFWGPPMRLGTTAEITLLTLRRA
ncbi:metallophosphoesterase [Myxococcota bacterium]|nr:metallophosphoesterase [Myxococcota bacterium]